jgi:1-acyl-sn-glycerol-3-phosphate acyltransferase
MLFGLKALLIILLTVPIGILMLCVAPFDRDGKLAYRLSQFWMCSVLKIGGIRLTIEGAEHLDRDSAYVFIANHQSNIDIPVLSQTLSGFQLRWMAKRELVRIPLFGWAMRASRHIVVDRSDRADAMASLHRARAIVHRGISVVFFPEGTRGTSGRLLPFKRGGFVLSVKTRTPIVPVTIKGSQAVLPKGDWRIRPGEIRVIVGRPIFADASRAGALGRLVDQVREIIESESRKNGASDRGSPGPATAEAPRQR